MKKKRRILLRVYDRLAQRFGPQGWWPGESPIEVVIGAVLTQNTSWENVELAIQNLKTAGVLTPKRLFSTSQKRLAEMIRPAGYFSVKARYIHAFLSFLFDRYRGDLKVMLSEPAASLREKVLSIAGIGPETADSILLYTGGHPSFVVDNYTRRVFSKHGWVAEETEYDPLRATIMETLPENPALYNEYHTLLVRVGKEYCRKVPVCQGCPLETMFRPRGVLDSGEKAASFKREATRHPR